MTEDIQIFKRQLTWTLPILNTEMHSITLTSNLLDTDRIIIIAIPITVARICAIFVLISGVPTAAVNAWAAIFACVADTAIFHLKNCGRRDAFCA